MDINQGVMLAECVERERQERIQLAAERWYLNVQPTQQPTLREALAGTLIALARRIAPQHAALSVQHR